jgi:two-component system sensor histidine kinase/response regulator
MKNMNSLPKIIIIDDEEVVLDSCTQILEGSNYDVTVTQNGEMGLNLVKEIHPDLVFIDLKMPGLSGIQVLEEIKALDPTIVTAVITGFATIDSAVEAMKRGAYDFLPKPFTPDEFRVITRRGIERRMLVLETIKLRKEKDLLRENFSAIVSHELKSPLGAIQQNLYALDQELGDNLTNTQKARLERMKVRIDDLIKLITSWLRVLSVDIGKIRDSFEPLQISSLILKAVESVEPHAVRKDIRIITAIDEKLCSIEGDEISFVEALVNVIDNAVKYSYVGSEVYIDAKERGGNIEISVADTGVGISKEELPQIFSDFYRGNSGQSIEGSHGIGLTISRRIIETHDGTLSVESEAGKSTTFTISIPTIQHKNEQETTEDNHNRHISI